MQEATAMQQLGIKELARQVLARNRQRNNTATPLSHKGVENDPFLLHGPESWNACSDSETATDALNQEHMDVIKAGHPALVWCGVFDDWVYWVLDEEIKRRLRDEGCTLPIYTLGELALVAAMSVDPRPTRELFDGTVTDGKKND
jgi:hypothetical protein